MPPGEHEVPKQPTAGLKLIEAIAEFADRARWHTWAPFHADYYRLHPPNYHLMDATPERRDFYQRCGPARKLRVQLEGEILEQLKDGRLEAIGSQSAIGETREAIPADAWSDLTPDFWRSAALRSGQVVLWDIEVFQAGEAPQRTIRGRRPGGGVSQKTRILDALAAAERAGVQINQTCLAMRWIFERHPDMNPNTISRVIRRYRIPS